MSFEKKLKGYRYIATFWGETIQKFAARVMGDAAKWVEIANLNNLMPPYLAAEPNSDRVAAYGDMLMVPAAKSMVTVESDPDAVFGGDILLNRGELLVENGDIKTVSGVKNYVQAIRHRVETDTGELLFHRDYGCRVRSVIGLNNAYSAGMIAGSYIKAAIKSDVRTKNVPSCRVGIAGDVISIDVDAVPVSGRPVQSIAWELK